MFNFSIFTKALTDNTLSKNEFRVLCLMLNTSSFKQSNTIEMYNGYIQDTLGISERNARDITKSLELKDYIKKEVNINSHNRNANRYTILGTEKCTEKCAENCPPNNLDINNNNNNITKDLSTSTRTSTEVTLLQENKKYKIKNISSEVTPSTGTFQDEVESVFLNSSDDEWLSYEVKRSMTDDVNNDLKLNDMKKENEMSNKVAIEMNAISEQSERQARENESSESGKENEMTTSTSGDKNKTSKEFQNIPVDKSKVINEENDTPKGLTPHPQIALHPLSPSAWDEDAIFGSGEPKNVSDDKLSTNEEKTRQNAQECPQNETDVFKRISEILEEALVITDVEPFKAKLQEAIDLLKQVRPSANINAFTRCCDDTIYWFKNNNFDDLDIFFAASDFKRNIEQMKRA